MKIHEDREKIVYRFHPTEEWTPIQGYEYRKKDGQYVHWLYKIPEDGHVGLWYNIKASNAIIFNKSDNSVEIKSWYKYLEELEKKVVDSSFLKLDNDTLQSIQTK